MDKKEEQLVFKGKYSYAVGKRKDAIAKVRLYVKGKGRIVINDRQLENYFPRLELRLNLQKPLELTGKTDSYDISAVVSGGGYQGQSDAIRLAIAKSLVDMDKDVKPVLKKAGLLTRDSRVKERKKPGLRKARRAPQWQKR